MRGVIERLRHLMVPVCLVMAGATLVVIAWGTAKTVSLAERLLEDSGWKRDALVGELLKTLDLFLIGAVLVVVTVALWQIFVADLNVPPSLKVTSLAALKRKFSDLLVIVIAVEFASQFLSGVRGLDLLYAGASVALVGAALVAFSRASANELLADGSRGDRTEPPGRP